MVNFHTELHQPQFTLIEYKKYSHYNTKQIKKYI